MKLNKSNKGFTLIELLVVIAIIAILSGIIVTSLTSSKLKSRDASRVSDLNQIQLALEQYFDRCGQYPTNTAGQPSTYSSSNPVFPSLGVFNGCPLDSSGNQITLGSYISVIPVDPSTGNAFDYKTNVTANTPPTDFVLHAKLEAQENPQQNSYPDSVKQGWASSVACYNSGSSSSDYQLGYCVSTK